MQLTLEQKKQAILKVICQRALELEDKAIEWLELTTKKENIDYQAVSDSALKKALQEFKENKKVF